MADAAVQTKPRVFGDSPADAHIFHAIRRPKYLREVFKKYPDADANIVEPSQGTPLNTAIRIMESNGDTTMLAIISILLKNGADPHFKATVVGQTQPSAYELARDFGLTNITKLFEWSEAAKSTTATKRAPTPATAVYAEAASSDRTEALRREFNTTLPAHELVDNKGPNDFKVFQIAHKITKKLRLPVAAEIRDRMEAVMAKLRPGNFLSSDTSIQLAIDLLRNGRRYLSDGKVTKNERTGFMSAFWMAIDPKRDILPKGDRTFNKAEKLRVWKELTEMLPKFEFAT